MSKVAEALCAREQLFPFVLAALDFGMDAFTDWTESLNVGVVAHQVVRLHMIKECLPSL